VVPLSGLVHPREPVPAALALRRQVHGDHLHGRGADEAPGRYGIGALEGGHSGAPAPGCLRLGGNQKAKRPPPDCSPAKEGVSKIMPTDRLGPL